MRRSIIEHNHTGVCRIDIPTAIKHWNLLCRLKKHLESNEYRLYETTLKGKCKFIVSISQEQGDELISQLQLTEVQHDIFKRVKIYLIL